MAIRLSVGAGTPPSAPRTAARPSVGRSPKRATHIDLALAKHIRARRVALGLTQQELAERIGVSLQQTHKYETGRNRLSIGRLVAICQALTIELSELLEDMASVAGSQAPGTKDHRPMMRFLPRGPALVDEPPPPDLANHRHAGSWYIAPDGNVIGHGYSLSEARRRRRGITPAEAEVLADHKMHNGG
jgi:transcriptional regulator with XRE-family HTH domain